MSPKLAALVAGAILVVCSQFAAAQSVGDTVWQDVDGDGVYDASEPGVPGAQVQLLTCSDAVLASTTTNASGQYLFSGLAVGSYRVRFIAPTGYRFTTPGVGSGGTDSNADPATGRTSCDWLAAGQSRLGIDAGLVANAGNGSMGDRVWQDSNGDGIAAASEPGLANVEVRLLNCKDVTLATTRTSVGGGFLFTGLPVGSYRLRFIAPAGYRFTTPGVGSGGTDSNPDPATGLTSCESLAAGQARLGIDAGLVPSNSTEPLNVLFIAVDDLRPEFGAYGASAIRTPHLDALAREGTIFTRAYAQMSLCSPSRTSLLTGLRPDTARVTDLATHFRTTVPGVVTLPQYFKNRGYRTQGFCKIFHDSLNDAQSWSVPQVDHWGPAVPVGADGKKVPYAAVNVPDAQFGDHKCATAAVDAIHNVAQQNQPFFIAVGFRKPHLPFLAPPAYFALYNPNAIPMAPNLFKAFDAPAVAFENRSELLTYSGIPPIGQPLGQTLARNLKHGYYAATSFVDAQVGRVLAALEASGAGNNTIVVVFGDHGFHLGEQNDWAKHTNFEVGTRVPLIIRVPGGTPAQASNALVELSDLYPTLVELAGLPTATPAQRGGYPLQGDSLVRFIDNPSARSPRGAFSQFQRNSFQGYSIRTNRYRYTEWVKGTTRQLELYDHSVDPDETLNVAYRPEYATVRSTLQTALDAGAMVDLPLSLR